MIARSIRTGDAVVLVDRQRQWLRDVRGRPLRGLVVGVTLLGVDEARS